MTTFLADGPKNSNRSSTSGFIGICVLGLLCGGFVGWRLLPKEPGKPDVSVSVIDAKGAQAAPAATASIPASQPVVAQLAQRGAAGTDTDESATRRRLSDGLKAFGGLPGLRAGTPPAPQPSAADPRPEAALTAAPPQSPVVEAIKPVPTSQPAAPERAALSQAPAPNPQAQSPSVAPPAIAAPQPQVAALQPAPTASAPAASAAPATGTAPSSVAAPAPARSATADEDDVRFLDMANGMMRRGDIAGARVILNRLYREGSKQAAFALAQTYDPANLRSLNVRGMLADGTKAQALYEEAAAAGIAGAQDRAQALKATAGR